MEIPNVETKVYFNGDTVEIISDILTKYSLKETDEEIAKKLFGKEDEIEPFVFHGEIILKTAISLFKKELSEQGALALLQKELNINQQMAEAILGEIKSRLISIANINKPITEISKNNPAPIISDLNISNSEIPANEPIENSQTVSNPVAPKRLPRIKQENISEEIKNSIPPTTQRSGPDNYREPIE